MNGRLTMGCALLLLIVNDHLRRRFTRLDLRADLLQARSKRLNLLLLLRDSRFLFGSS